MALDFSDLGGKPVKTGAIDFTDLGGTPIDNGSQDNQSLLQKAGSYLQNKAVDFATDVTGPQRAGEYIGDKLPVTGAVIGGAILPGAGVPLGAGTGQIAKRMIGIATGAEAPSGTPLQEAAGPMLQAAGSGLLETAGAQNAIQSAAQSLGRRSLGIAKGMIKRAKGGVDTTNQYAQEMLDKGVIQPFSTAKSMIPRAEAVLESSGKAIGDTLAKAGENAIDTNDVAGKVIDQLAPNYTGGDYDAQQRIVQEIADTVVAHGNGPIDFESAQTLKKTLKQSAGNNWNSDKLKASMYQRAYGIVNKAIEDGLEKVATANQELPIAEGGLKTGEPHALYNYDWNQADVGGTGVKKYFKLFGDPQKIQEATGGAHVWGTDLPEETVSKFNIPIKGRLPNAKVPEGSLPKNLVADYIANKKTYGAATAAIEGLRDRAAAEASNSILSLRGAAVGAGALASGDVGHALEAIGTWESLRRVGPATGAATLHYLNNSPVGQNVRKALVSEFINRFIVGKQGVSK